MWPNHRKVMAAELGRPLLPNEVVHHKDRNVRNDDPSNLVVMDRSEHARLHNREDTPKEWRGQVVWVLPGR